MRTNILLFIAVMTGLSAMGQSQAETFIQEAQDYLVKKEYKQAQLSLQDAINDINMLLAAQVAEVLPDEINGLVSDENEDINTASMGMIGGGMQITKRYQHPGNKANEAEVQILANSPMLSSMSMYLSNPGMMGSEYKSVRVGATRAILKTEMQEYYDDNGSAKKIRSTEIQIPLNQTLITLNARGFATEQDELAFAVKLDLEKIRAAQGE